MVIRAQTEDGQPVQVSFPQWLSWLTGLMATLITATVISTAAKLIDIETRVTAIEATRMERADFVSVREYDATVLGIQSQLARIEVGVDRLQEGR